MVSTPCWLQTYSWKAVQTPWFLHPFGCKPTAGKQFKLHTFCPHTLVNDRLAHSYALSCREVCHALAMLPVVAPIWCPHSQEQSQSILWTYLLGFLTIFWRAMNEGEELRAWFCFADLSAPSWPLQRSAGHRSAVLVEAGSLSQCRPSSDKPREFPPKGDWHHIQVSESENWFGSITILRLFSMSHHESCFFTHKSFPVDQPPQAGSAGSWNCGSCNSACWSKVVRLKEVTCSTATRSRKLPGTQAS